MMDGTSTCGCACDRCRRRDGRHCDPCFEIVCDTIAADRVRFNKLIAAGVNRGMANRIMIARIDNELPS